MLRIDRMDPRDLDPALALEQEELNKEQIDFLFDNIVRKAKKVKRKKSQNQAAAKENVADDQPKAEPKLSDVNLLVPMKEVVSTRNLQRREERQKEKDERDKKREEAREARKAEREAKKQERLNKIEERQKEKEKEKLLKDKKIMKAHGDIAKMKSLRNIQKESKQAKVKLMRQQSQMSVNKKHSAREQETKKIAVERQKQKEQAAKKKQEQLEKKAVEREETKKELLQLEAERKEILAKEIGADTNQDASGIASAGKIAAPDSDEVAAKIMELKMKEDEEILQEA